MKRHALSAMALGVMFWSPLWSQDAEDPTQPYPTLTRRYYELLSSTHGNPLGIEVAPAEATLRAQLGVEEGVGVVITSVSNEKDATKLGLKPHDVVLKFDECPVTSPEKFHELVGSEQGKTIRLHLLRQGKPLSVSVPIPRAQVYTLLRKAREAVPAEQRYRIGVALAEADDTLRTQLKLAASEGLVVTGVVDDSPAAKAGIKQHDVLIKLDNKRLSTVESVNEQIQETKDRQVTLVYLRAGQELSCNLTPQLSRESSGARGEYERTVRGLMYHYRDLDRPDRVAKEPVRWSVKVEAATAADQLAELKKQLEQVQKTVQSLEAALQPAAKENEKEKR